MWYNRGMNIVLYLAVPRTTTCAQQKFVGASQRLMHNGFSLRRVDIGNCTASDLRELVSFWNARGIILDCGGQRPPVRDRLLPALPTVYLDVARKFETSDKLSVSYDIRATCHMAARELLSLDCTTYAYAGYGTKVPWSEERKRVFAKAMKLNGHAIETFGLNPADATPSAFYRKLSAWIQKIRKPAGLFVADDAYAIHLHAVVQRLELRIPSEIAILGVDNESDKMATPGISSIQLDFQKAGSLAADLLLDRISLRVGPHAIRHFGPIQLLRRISTRKIHRLTGNLSAIIHKIREQAPHGLTAAEAASWMSGSRRLAEARFRAATGHSFLEEITAARIERAKELLVTTDYSIGEISELCGYHTFNAFRNAFKATTEQTPREWKKQTRASPEGVPNGVAYREETFSLK